MELKFEKVGTSIGIVIHFPKFVGIPSRFVFEEKMFDDFSLVTLMLLI